MKPKLKLHPEETDGYYGCGPAALSLLFGGEPEAWQSRILRHRRKHRPTGCTRWKDELHDGDNTYDSEMRHFLRKHLGINPKFVRPKRPCRLKNLSLPDGTFLVMLSNHFLVWQNDHCYDGQSTSVHKSQFRFRNDLVESWQQLPDYENWRDARTLSPSMRWELENMLFKFRYAQGVEECGRWRVVWVAH